MQALIIKNKKFRASWATPNSELNSFIEAALAKSKLVAPILKNEWKGAPEGGPLGSQDQADLSLANSKKLNSIKSKSKIRNICVVTGRTRANHLEYKLSRLKLKIFAEAGLIPGLKKI